MLVYKTIKNIPILLCILNLTGCVSIPMTVGIILHPNKPMVNEQIILPDAVINQAYSASLYAPYFSSDKEKFSSDSKDFFKIFPENSGLTIIENTDNYLEIQGFPKISGNIKVVGYSVIPHYPGTKTISEYHLTILPSLNSCSNLHTESTTSLPNKEKIYHLRPNSYPPNAILNQPYSIMVSTPKNEKIQNIFSSYSWLQFKLIKKGSRNIYQLYGTPTILGNAEISLSSFWLANIHMNIYPSTKNACYTPTPPKHTTSRYFDSHE